MPKVKWEQQVTVELERSEATDEAKWHMKGSQAKYAGYSILDANNTGPPAYYYRVCSSIIFYVQELCSATANVG